MPETLKITSGSDTIDAYLYSPTETAVSGLVVIAYGADGLTDDLTGPWETMIRGYADSLLASGFFALIPDYFGKTGTAPGPELLKMLTDPRPEVINMLQKNRRDWEAALSDAVTHGGTLPGVDASRVGLLGFSLGGHLCMRIRAASKPKVMVAFFAPVFSLLGELGPSGNVAHAEIHHGEVDSLVPFQNATIIKDTLEAESTSTTLFAYPGAGHGFNGDDDHNKTARTLSKSRTLSFFETHL